MNQCPECGETEGRHAEWCEIGSVWKIPWRGIIVIVILGALVTLWLCGCTTLYPEDSPEREREHEAFEMHMKHIGR